MKTSDEIFTQFYKDNPTLEVNRKDIENAYKIIKQCAITNSQIMCCGNGGSAADCEHITGELMKGFLLRRPLPDEDKKKFEGIENGNEIASKLQKGIRCISLVSQSGVISAFANDVDPSLIFGQQVFAYAESKNDVLIALSTSGNSKNIVNAAKCAKAAGIKSIAVTGEKDSLLSSLCDVTIKLPSHDTYRIQEMTLPVYHVLCAATEADMFKE